MLNVEKNIILANHTTFKIGGRAKFFVVVKNLEEFLEALKWAKLEKQAIFILGGGSNTLFSDRGWKGLVIKNEIKGIKVIKDNKDSALVEGQGGEWWASLVNFGVANNYYGAENLALIPGTVGAAPVQNIGAYGVELKDIFYNLKAVNLKTRKPETFSAKDCQFAYRTSVFKNKLKNKYFIYGVTLKLSKKPNFKLDYGEIKTKLDAVGKNKPTARDVIEVIMALRNSKLPNPAILPNAGSFFKNPEISLAKFNSLKKKFPDIKYFASGDKIKIPAGWLIEQCGFKGGRWGDAGVYANQALILVNYGEAKARDILNLAKKITTAVKKKFGIKIEEEVNLIK